jgi:hypothetical protein
LRAKRNPVTLLVVDEDARAAPTPLPRIPIPNAPPAIYADATTKIKDATLSAHTFAYCCRTPISLLTSQGTEDKLIIPKTRFLVSMASVNGGGDFGSTEYHVISHRPTPGREYESIEAVVAREYQKLTCLGRQRFGFGGYLPCHLEAVRVIINGLSIYAGAVDEF